MKKRPKTVAPKSKAPAPKVKAKSESPTAALAARFALDDVERRIFELAYEAERGDDASELTVRRVRALVGRQVDAALSPKRALRRHALVAVGVGGLPAADDRVRLAPGVLARVDGAAEPDGLWLGCSRVTPGGRGDVPARIAALLGELGGAAATLLTLDGCTRREAHELALGLARRLARGVLVVDGELVADAPAAALLLACARREADCEGDVLVVCEAGRLGERWRALLAPPTGEPAALLVLADGERTRDPVAAAPFAVRRLSLHPPAPTAKEPAPATSDARADEKAAPVDDGFEQIRQQAIRDAERALGIFRAPPPPPRSPTTPVPATQPARPQTPSPPQTQQQQQQQQTQQQPQTQPQQPQQGAAPAPPPPAPAKPGVKRSAKGAQFFGGEEVAPPTPAPPPAAVAPPPVDASAFAGDGTPVALTPDAAPDELARVAATSPSAAQRVELINRLRTIKSATVVAALRANAASQHPAVRAAAEAAMASLFGPNWNATRPIPKPVQPPPSDDKDRGPPGGW